MSDVEHPAAFRLEAWSAGEPDAHVATHVYDCDACRAYTDGLKSAQIQFLATHDPADVVRALRLAEPAPRSKRWLWIMGPVLGAATAALVWFASPPRAALQTDAPTIDTIRFKGTPLQLAVIVAKPSGAQARVSNDVAVHAGDRIRFELVLAASATVTIGLLDDDGTFVELVEAAALSAGTHHPERTLRVDERPTNAWLLAGAPEAVAKAAKTRDFGEVQALRLTSK